MARPAVKQLTRVTEWVGETLLEEQRVSLAEYAAWLVSEAIPAGGLGPDEARRVWDRHICDSLAFAIAWKAAAPIEAVDLGSGVGLPGIPLAILWPETEWTLLDRSARRIGLARRAIRVLGLGNVSAVQSGLEQHRGLYDGAVARGVMEPEVLARMAVPLLSSTGRLAIGLSRAEGFRKRVSEGSRVVEVPAEVLDGGAQILIIDSCER